MMVHWGNVSSRMARWIYCLFSAPSYSTHLSYPTSSYSRVIPPKEPRWSYRCLFLGFPHSLLPSLYPWRWFCWCRVYFEEAYSSPLHAEGFGHGMFRIICPYSHYQVTGCILGQDLEGRRPQSGVEWNLDHPTGFLEGLKPFHLLWVNLPKCLCLDYPPALSLGYLSKEINISLL